VYQWVLWLGDLFDSNGNHIYPTPITRTTVISLYHGIDGTLDDTTPEDKAWEISAQSLPLRSRIARATWIVPLSSILPSGAEITAIRVLVHPGDSRSTESERMHIYLTEVNYDVTLPSVGVNQIDDNFDDGNATLQPIALTGLSEVLAPQQGQELYVAIECGVDAQTNKDRIYAIEVVWEDNGLRNF
jgi:hypothetical protein